ncbi:hypothetical protein [Comamonas testosteroni]|jgi:hypothetical protein|uniref:hypothetical protein n=1 Tax=Comamonas testosteroni TaxID=285 RepID=UPI0026F06780|nr:hypothetical protein [Comamonas testosteroni]
MSLVTTLEALQKSPLSAEDANKVREFQNQFQIDDEDPLVVVLALMMKSQLIIDSAPDLLQQKVIETIELHKTNLREQAVLSAKELVSDIAATLLHQQKNLAVVWRLRLMWAGIGAGAASVLFVLAIVLVGFLK